METFFCVKHLCGGTGSICPVCVSQMEHPAGKKKFSIHDEVWAISTALRLGAERERKRIIDLIQGDSE